MICIEQIDNPPEMPEFAQLMYKIEYREVVKWNTIFVIPNEEDNDYSYLSLMGWSVYTVDKNNIIQLPKSRDLKVRIVLHNGKYYTDDTYRPFIREIADLEDKKNVIN